MRDLIVLCADQDAALGVRSLLERPKHLGIREIDFQVIRHPNRDNGVFQQAHELLRSQCRRFSRAIAICDFEGCGKERKNSRQQIEALIEQRLQANGWAARAAAIVIDPELEAWAWGDWDALAEYLEWIGGADELRGWLMQRKMIEPARLKPQRPKESLDRALRQTNKARSSSLFVAIGHVAETDHCTDPAFHKLISKLQQWFPAPGNASATTPVP